MPQIVNVDLKSNPYNIIIGDKILENIDDLHRQYFVINSHTIRVKRYEFFQLRSVRWVLLCSWLGGKDVCIRQTTDA